ncbi:MAG TPA: hypothetical protein VD866_17945 [Urbifossiella sp.]|nr:hypothetical protein [Urbifossiella sp.]
MKKLILAAVAAVVTLSAGGGCRMFERDRNPSHSYRYESVPVIVAAPSVHPPG